MLRIITIVFTIFTFVAPATAGDKLIAISAAQRAALRIATAPLQAHAGAMTVGLPATVIIPPAQERVVAAPAAGLLAQVLVASGDHVAVGQGLAVLRAEEIVAGQRELAQTAAQASLAEAALARDQALFKEGIIPEARLQTTRANQVQAQAALAERRARLRLMGLSASAIASAEKGHQLSDSVTLSAPIAGVILEQKAAVGARVDPTTSLFRVARLDPLWLEIQAPAEVAGLIRKGQAVSLADGGAKGKVIAVGQGVSASQTVPVRAVVDNAKGTLRLNQVVSVKLEGLAGQRQWRVPVKSVIRQEGQNWVFIERATGFEPEAIKVISQTATEVAIDGPFAGNEKIAVEGIAALKAAWQGN
jgi:RND family efflux transporter MFP subunit